MTFIVNKLLNGALVLLFWGLVIAAVVAPQSDARFFKNPRR